MNTMQRSEANCPPLSWIGSVISLFWQQKTDDLRAYVVILDLECIHMTGSQSLIVLGNYLWSTLSNSLSVWMSHCLLCMHNMYMYICICMLSTVGTGVLTCSIIVLHLLYWFFYYFFLKKVKKKKNKKKENFLVVNFFSSKFGH